MSDRVFVSESAICSTPDVYFDHDYGIADAEAIGGTWHVAASPAGSWILPFTELETPNGFREAMSPYGYSGIHVDRAMKASEIAAHWAETRNLLEDRGVVSLFLRFNPLDPTSLAAVRELSALRIVRSGTTFARRIGTTTAMWERIAGRARTEVRKAWKNGMSARVRPLEPAELKPGTPFRALYDETMKRVGAAPRYLFDDNYFQTFGISPCRDYIVEVERSCAVVASAIIMRHLNRAHYHLSGSQRVEAKQGANSLLLWSVLEWCAEQGVELFHLGGGQSEGDGLARFKQSFADLELEFFTGQSVVIPRAYNELVRLRARDLEASPEDLLASEYFPAFRANIP